MPNLLDQVFRSEQQQFIDNNQNVPASFIQNPIDEKGNVVFNIATNSETVEHLLSNWTAVNYNDFEHFNPRSYLTDVTANIYKPTERVEFTEAISTAYALKQSEGDNLAGMLLVKGSRIINPFHPLTALSILDNPDIMKGKWTMIFYFYENRIELDEIYYTVEADSSRITDNINAQLRLYASKLKSRDVKVLDSVIRNNGTIDQRFQVEMEPGELHDTDYFIVTHQLLTYGIVAPYYGTSIIRIQNKNNVRGQALSPAQSANISERTWSPQWNSVCTGSTPSETIKGIKTLTHANLSSPLNRACMTTGSLAYFDACIDTSLDIYASILPIKG